MHFTEDEIREIRNRLPLEVPTVTDSLQSSDGSSALSAKQGKLIDERLVEVEGEAIALRNVETVYRWAESPSIYSMVEVPYDSPNNVTNARVAYELKKRTDDLTTSVNYIMQIISELGTGGGGGGGSTVSWGVELSNHTVPLIVNGVSKTICLDGYSSGGGGTGGGYIGSTQVQTNSTPGQNLEGIGNATLSGNLSVAGTSTLTGNVTIGGTVFLPATGKIVFGSNASTDPFIEFNNTSGVNQFHFNRGLYSDQNVTAGGVGSGGGGGGASSLNDLSDVTVGTLTSADDGKVLAFDYDSGTNPQWKPKALTIQDIAGISSPTTGYLKYDNGSWSLANGTTVLDNVLGPGTGRTRIVTIDGTDIYSPSGSGGGATYLYQLDDVNISSTYSSAYEGYPLVYHHTSGGGEWTIASSPSGGTSVSWGTVSGYTAQLTVGNVTKTVCLNGYSTGGGGTGTVTSVGLSMPSCFTVTGSPVTTSGTLTASFSSQTANYVLAAPSSASGTPSFRALVAADIPSLPASKITSGTLDSGRIPDLSGTYVTLTTDQHTISGAKSFTNSAGIGIGSSSHTLKYNSTAGRFEFNGNLYVTGNIVATGNVTAGS